MPGETKFCASVNLLHVHRALIVANHDAFNRPGVYCIPEGSIDLTRDLLLPQLRRTRTGGRPGASLRTASLRLHMISKLLGEHFLCAHIRPKTPKAPRAKLPKKSAEQLHLIGDKAPLVTRDSSEAARTLSERCYPHTEHSWCLGSNQSLSVGWTHACCQKYKAEVSAGGVV